MICITHLKFHANKNIAVIFSILPNSSFSSYFSLNVLITLDMSCNNDMCVENAVCTEVQNGFICTCAEGYKGNGTHCTGLWLFEVYNHL